MWKSSDFVELFLLSIVQTPRLDDTSIMHKAADRDEMITFSSQISAVHRPGCQ